MNLLQTLYIANDPLGFKSNYPSVTINWLTMAYSALLINKHYDDKDLYLYGNRSVLSLMLDGLNLPYKNGIELSNNIEYQKLFYAYGKIETYKLQKDPFLHIDNDIFLSCRLPEDLLNSNIIAQHKEADSTFYKRVREFLKTTKVELPKVMDSCFNDDFVFSYNMGLFGGHDMEFFEYYTNSIDNLIQHNYNKLRLTQKPFLFNVVFEQWLLYALAAEQNRHIDTYYKDEVVDFRLQVSEHDLAIMYPKTEYLHLMNFKKDYTCYNAIIRKMRDEFPCEYDYILRFLYDKGVRQDVVMIDNNTQNDFMLKASDSDFNVLYDNASIVDNCNSSKDIDILFENCLNISRANYNKIDKQHQESYKYLQDIVLDDTIVYKLNYALHDYCCVVDIANIQDKIINSNKRYENIILIMLYAPIYDQVKKFVLIGFDAMIISDIVCGINTSVLMKKYDNNAMVMKFIMYGLFNGFIKCTKD